MCGWFKTLTPEQELSVFLSARGGVLSQVSKDLDNALVAFAHAARLWPTSAQPIQRAKTALEGMYGKIVAAHPEAYGQMVARLDAQERGASRLGTLPPRAGGDDSPAGNVPWWKTEAGRAAKLAEIERTNEENRRNMQRIMQPPQPYRPPTPGAQQPRPPSGARPGYPEQYQQPTAGQQP